MSLQKRVPVTILTGFLGAGKTTLLNHLLHADHGLRVAVLVNDFGEINIDSQLIVGVEADDAITLSNGCICCTIRDDLRQATLQLFQRPDPPEYILIEPSGVSDPLSVGHTFTETELAQYVAVDSIIAVVDAEQFLNLPQENVVLAMDQIGIADLILLNKIDLVRPEQLVRVRDGIRQMVPKARFLETTFARAPVELILGVGNYDPQRLLSRSVRDVHVHGTESSAHGHADQVHDHADHAQEFRTWSYAEKRPFAFRAVQKLVNKLPLGIYRAKGVLYLNEAPDRRCVLQVVGKRARIVVMDPWQQEAPHSQVVVIGTPTAVDAEALTAAFDACLVENQPSRSLLGTAVEWVRSAWELAAQR